MLLGFKLAYRFLSRSPGQVSRLHVLVDAIRVWVSSLPHYRRLGFTSSLSKWPAVLPGISRDLHKCAWCLCYLFIEALNPYLLLAFGIPAPAAPYAYIVYA